MVRKREEKGDIITGWRQVYTIGDESSSMQRVIQTLGNTGCNWVTSERVCNMSHESRAGGGTKDKGGGWEQEQDQEEQAEGDRTRGGSQLEILEQLEGAEIIRIRGKREENGDIITWVGHQWCIGGTLGLTSIEIVEGK